MTADTTEDKPTTAAEFQTRLESLVRTAVRNGIDVRGGWAIQTGDSPETWDVHVTEVVPPESDD